MRRLAIRAGAIGDFILSLPALECLRTDYLEVWAAAPNVPLVRFAPARSIRDTGLDLLGITEPPPNLLATLRSFDSIFSWYGSNRPEFRELVNRLDLPFTFFPALPPEDAGCHAADFYLDQIAAVATCSSDGIPRITCEAPSGVTRDCLHDSGTPPPGGRGSNMGIYVPIGAAAGSSTVRKQGFAVIHPFSGSPRKNWPLAKFRALAEGLQRTLPVYWCRGDDDPPLENAVRIDNLYHLSCWLARAALYVGNDSGITHLAAAAGTPVLALFGPTDPAVWGPRGPNVRIARWNKSGALQ